jgi:hypothetical protein
MRVVRASRLVLGRVADASSFSCLRLLSHDKKAGCDHPAFFVRDRFFSCDRIVLYVSLLDRRGIAWPRTNDYY